MEDVKDPQYRTSDGSALRIWRDTLQNRFLSEREGRPVFDEVILVEVISPGSRDSTPTFECVRNFAPEMGRPEPRLGAKYAEYKQFIDDFVKSEIIDASLSGTPLSQWPEMTRTMVSSLKAQNIFTVDALANLPDTKLQVVGPDGRTWREKAKAYIASANGNAYATALAADLEREKANSVDLQNQVKALAEQVAALQAASTSGTAPAPAPKAAKGAAAVDLSPAKDSNPVETGIQNPPSII